MTYACAQCKKQFQNGEFVGLSSGQVYHKINDLFVGNIMPVDCGMKKFMNDRQNNLMSFGFAVFYADHFYDLDKLSELPSSKELMIGLNEARTGHIIRGNLEGLAQKGFLRLPGDIEPEPIPAQSVASNQSLIQRLRSYLGR